jgi:hypothetical protein
MDEYESLSHTRWDCKYHVVFIPKCRRKALYGELRRHLGEVFKKLAAQKESRIEEGHLTPDHVHDRDPSEIRGFSGGGIHQGQERDSFGAGLCGTETKFCWAAFLGARIFRFDRGAGRRRDPRIYPQPGTRRRASGAIEPMAITPGDRL